MDDYRIKMALCDIQRALRDLCGYAPQKDADFIGYHIHDEPDYKVAEALDFYAHAGAAEITKDGGKIARETLGHVREKTRIR